MDALTTKEYLELINQDGAYEITDVVRSDSAACLSLRYLSTSTGDKMALAPCLELAIQDEEWRNGIDLNLYTGVQLLEAFFTYKIYSSDNVACFITALILAGSIEEKRVIWDGTEDGPFDISGVLFEQTSETRYRFKLERYSGGPAFDFEIPVGSLLEALEVMIVEAAQSALVH